MAKVAITTMLVTSMLAGEGALLASPADAVIRPCSFHHTVYGNKRTIRCFARRMNVSEETAVAIAGRESSFDEWAVNDYSGALGLFQHLRRYWPGRVRMAHRKLRKFHVRHVTWHNPRAQAVVTNVYVKRYGWCPAWTTANC